MILALEEQQQQVASIVQRMDSLEAKNQGMEMAYAQLPIPDEVVPTLSKRDLINMSVRGYCITHDHNYQSAFGRLYTEYRYRYHIDLLARRTGKETGLDVATRLGMLNDLYALSILLFGEE